DGLSRLIKVTEPANGRHGDRYYRPVTEYKYSADGKISKITHPDGSQITMEFNYGTNLLLITNERGFHIEERYDMDERLIRVTEYSMSDNREVKHYYDGLGNEIITIDPDGTDPAGRITTYHYDVLNRLEKIEYPEETFWEDGYEASVSPYIRYEYNGAGYRTAEIVSMPGGRERVTGFEVDGLGRVIRVNVPYTDEGTPELVVTEVYYDENGNKVKVIDANNTRLERGERRYLEYTYTARDEVRTEKDPEGNTTGYTYYPDGMLESETDPRGNSDNYEGYRGDFVTTYHYDRLGRLEYKELPLSPGEERKPVIRYTWYSNGNAGTVTAPDGGVTRYTYTSRNLVETETITGDGKEYTRTNEYDERGNETREVDSRGYTTIKHYDEWDRLDYIIYPELNQESYEYDKNDNVTALIDGRFNRTEYRYDKYDRRRAGKDAKSSVTEYRYDRLGNLTRVEGAVGNITIYEYDELSRLIKEIRGLPDFMYTYRYRYDAVGNTVYVRDPKGTEGVYEYDFNNRLKRVLLNGGTKVVEYEYDEAGYKKRVIDDGVETLFNHIGSEYEPDPYGRIRYETTKIDGMEFTTEYRYDVTGRVTGSRSPKGGWVIYRYNKVGELLEVPGYIVPDTIRYDGGGFLESAEAMNGVEASWSYDGNGRVVSMGYSRGGMSLKEYSFTYDEAGNIVWRNDSYFEYDELNQLIFENRADAIKAVQQERVGHVEEDLFGQEPLEFVVIGTEIKLDYASSSIGVDLGLEVNVNRIELIPGIGNPVRVYDNEESLSIYSSNVNGEGSYTELSNWVINKKGSGVLEILFTPSEEARYIKVHSSYDERDENLIPVDRARFKDNTEELIRVYAYMETVGEELYEYDGAGNRVSETITGGGTPDIYESTMYSHTNRLKSNGRYAFVYDVNGNLVKKGTDYDIDGDTVKIQSRGEYWDYEYDLLNRLIRVSRNGELVVRYVYDG
ncbi:MAG: RHS repeat protein, partial [Spirochaetes bacterium]|nr:RHS repeat protein [Spirochaetota bacterium]